VENGPEEDLAPADPSGAIFRNARVDCSPITDKAESIGYQRGKFSRHVRCTFPLRDFAGVAPKDRLVEKEIIMKSVLFFLAVLCAVTLSSSSAPSAMNADNIAKKERAVMSFERPLQLMDVTLKGEYLFVHDDAAMARGDACTSVYKGNAENPAKLVATFHCIPAPRDKVATFTVRTLLTPSGQTELTEFQFAGSSETHLVPMNQHTAYVTVATVN
jgi:hypothetical protein